MQKFASLRPLRFTGNAGWLKLGLVILAGLIAASVGRAQNSFYSPLLLVTNSYGSITNDNTGVSPDTNAPNIAGFAPRAPLWFQWQAPMDGEVELDTLGSVTTSTNLIGFDADANLIFSTNVANLDTVLGVYQGSGSDPRYLNQIAANDDLYPINSTLGENGLLISPLPEQAVNFLLVPYYQLLSPYDIGSGFFEPELGSPGYYGPSHLRFTAKAGQTYYFAADTKYGTGSIVLNWAYKSSGVFGFASEDQDWVTGRPLYQTAETESQPPLGYGNVDVLSVENTYYNYNAPGALVTVTRKAGSTGRAVVRY